MPGTPMPYVRVQFLTDDGLPAEGYQLFSYEAGTTTKLATYSDVNLTSANTNPIVLDSAGSATIFLAADSYKFVLCLPTETDPPTGTAVWTRDNVTAVPELNANLDIAGVAGENLAAGEFVYCSAGDGGRTAGRWYKTDSDLTYGSIYAPAIGCVISTTINAAATGSIRIQGRVTGLSGLTAGSTYYLSATAGGITATAPTNARAVGIADTTTSLVFTQWVQTQDASATLRGIVSIGTQSFGGIKTFAAEAPRFGPGGTADVAIASGVIDSRSSVAGVACVNTNETVLFTYTLLANTLKQDAVTGIEPILRVSFRLGFEQDAGAKTVKFYLGSTALTLVNYAVNFAGNVGMFVCTIRCVGDGTAQMISGSGVVSTAANVAGSCYFAATTAAAENLATDLAVQVTGTGQDSDDVVGYEWLVEVLG